MPGEISPEGAANAPLETLGDGVIENRVDGMTLSTWVLDSSWEANDRSDEALRDLRALAEDPFKEGGTFTWSQCGDSSCLTVSDGIQWMTRSLLRVFSSLGARCCKDHRQRAFPNSLPIVPCLGRSWLEAQSRGLLSTRIRNAFATIVGIAPSKRQDYFLKSASRRAFASDRSSTASRSPSNGVYMPEV